jgi:uracil-DNA glycosylase
MDIKIESSWKDILQSEFDKDYFKKLSAFVDQEYNTQTVFPPANLIFNAFNQCPLKETKVVIIGQDPYHDDNQAHGLCFSVNDGIKIPPSLRNIYKELNQDLGIPIPESGNLLRWAKQGVLLLNATLTVRAHEAASHQRKGWEEFTDAVIQNLSEKSEGIVFLLWGSYAQKKGEVIDESKHLILKSVHPSPLSASRGFYGNHHFSRTNEYLVSLGKAPIEWEIPKQQASIANLFD